MHPHFSATISIPKTVSLTSPKLIFWKHQRTPSLENVFSEILENFLSRLIQFLFPHTCSRVRLSKEFPNQRQYRHSSVLLQEGDNSEWRNDFLIIVKAADAFFYEWKRQEMPKWTKFRAPVQFCNQKMSKFCVDKKSSQHYINEYFAFLNFSMNEKTRKQSKYLFFKSKVRL